MTQSFRDQSPEQGEVKYQFRFSVTMSSEAV